MPLEQTLDDCEAFLRGDYDGLAEERCYMRGAMQEDGVMTTFVLHLQGATQHEHVEDVASFVGEDASGSFGIQAGHGRIMTSLVYRPGALPQRRGRLGAIWRCPARVLYFRGNALHVSARRYLHDADYARISG